MGEIRDLGGSDVFVGDLVGEAEGVLGDREEGCGLSKSKISTVRDWIEGERLRVGERVGGAFCGLIVEGEERESGEGVEVMVRAGERGMR